MLQEQKAPKRQATRASAERAARIKSIRGRYAHVRTSSRRFADLKKRELELEDRHR